MAQRVMIAMALACEPELLIADEPTTALDVTIQAQILDLMRKLRDETGTAIILITHDLGVVAEMCDRVAVMYAGEIVEQTDVVTLFREPLHPYTQGLIGSIPLVGDVREELSVIPGNVPNLIDLPDGCRFAPRCSARVEENVVLALDAHPSLREWQPGHEVRCWLYHDAGWPAAARPGARDVTAQAQAGTSPPRPAAQAGEALVEVRGLVKHFPIKGGVLQRTVALVQAVDGVTSTSGAARPWASSANPAAARRPSGGCCCASSTPTAGEIRFDGVDITKISGAALKPYRRRMQIIFQDPFASLDPRTPIGDSIGEGLRIHGIGTLGGATGQGAPDHGHGRPHARTTPGAIPTSSAAASASGSASPGRSSLEPDLVVCDEPVSALDVSIQAQVLNLLKIAPARARPDVPVHRPQHGRRRAHQRPGRGDVPGQGRRGRGPDDAVPDAGAPVHAWPCSRRSRSRTRSCAASGSSSRATCRAR